MPTEVVLSSSGSGSTLIWAKNQVIIFLSHIDPLLSIKLFIVYLSLTKMTQKSRFLRLFLSVFRDGPSLMKKKKKHDSIAFFYKLNHKKAKVYENNWSAKNREQLIRKLRKRMKEFDMEPIIKKFDHLKAKIRKADQDRLRSLPKE